MRDELLVLKTLIDKRELPTEGDSLLDTLWDRANSRFHAQETHLLDYKESIPVKFTDDYGIGIVRLCIGYHNTFGGLIVFGVKDKELTVVGTDISLDIESLNRVLTDVSEFKGECIAKKYELWTDAAPKTICVALVPRRQFQRPVRLTRQFGKYQLGTLWIRDRAEVMESKTKHLPLIYSSRQSLPFETTESEDIPVHRSLPPSPSTVKTFIGREKLLVTLWDWLVFGDQPRLYLHGPGGSGKSTLAFEFSRLLTEAYQSISFASGGRLDYVIYISGKETELNTESAREQTYLLKQFDTSDEQFAQIAYHSGLLDQSEIQHASRDRVLALIDELFANFNGLIVIDDIDALHRRNVDTGEETLLFKALLGRGRT